MPHSIVRRTSARLVILMSLVYAGVLAPCAAYVVGMAAAPAARTLCSIAPEWCGDAWPARAARAVRHFASAVHYVDLSFPALVVALVLSVLGFGAVYVVVGASRSAFAVRGLAGIDLLKRDLLPRGTTPAVVPESLGLPCAALYLLVLAVFVPFRYFGPSAYGPLSADRLLHEGLHQDLASFLSAILSMYSGAFLGFVDDVLDIRWRYKLPIPLLSSIPMLVVYMASGGHTSVVVPGWPPFLRSFLGCTSLDLGIFYYVYMMLLATFCTNCINILAGINGVEIGQALVIATSVCINDLLYLDIPGVVRAAVDNPHRPPDVADYLRGYHGSSDLVLRHLFSLHLLLPFIGTSLGLLAWNRFPARVFVGDTYCYFAGMVLVSAGVLGHYSKTLLLFFLPQIFNFVLSCPQLFGLVPCPRHRVPFVDASSGKLYPSSVRLSHLPAPLRRVRNTALAILERLALVVRLYDEHGAIVGVTNLTLLNALLVARGSRVQPVSSAQLAACYAQADPALRTTPVPGTLKVSEHALWYHIMAVQVLGSVVAFSIRYWLASVVFPQ